MRKINIKIFATILIVLVCCYVLIASFFSPHSYTNDGEISIRGIAMDSTYSVTIADQIQFPIIKIKDETAKTLQHIENTFSLWQDDSELTLINQAPINTSIQISNEMTEIFNKSRYFYKLSNGLLDPTILPLLNLWGFGPNGDKAPPTEEEISNVAKKVDFASYKLNNNTLIKTNPEAQLDFSAIIPGYAADKIAELMEQYNIHNYLINIGGEMRISGLSPIKSPWIIGIEDPLNPVGKDEKIVKYIQLTSGGVATSGTYRKFKKHGINKIHHIINPRTYHPSKSDIVSITVLAPSALEADALSTFLLIMGSNMGLSWLNNYPQYNAFIIKEDGNIAFSDKLEPLFKLE